MAWWHAFRSRVLVVAPPRRGSTGESSDTQPTPGLQAWQKDAWGYYKTLGEIHNAAGFTARMLFGIELVVQERDAKGEWSLSKNQSYMDALQRIENSRGGSSALQASYAKLTFAQGEAMLCCTLEGLGEDDNGDPILSDEGLPYTECWEMLSAAELAYTKDSSGGEYKRRRKPNGKLETYPELTADDPQPGQMIAYRFYQRDPEFSGLADCSMRAILGDCEELLLLKQAIRNTARNRGAGNGILMLPANMGGEMVDSGDGKQIPKNAKAIYDALTVPINNEKAASAVAPVIMFAPPGTTSAQAFHIDLRGAALYRETGLRDECIRRIAIGLDMPPEALLGTAGVNHWTAWQIDEASWTNYGQPMASDFVEQLTAAILTPVVVEENGQKDDVRIWFDATKVVQDPDRGRSAMEAHDRLIISDESARRDMGYEETDAPSSEEWDKRAAIAKKPPGGDASPTKGEPKQGQAAIHEPVTPERIIGMAEGCLLRCRELAGSKFRTRMNQATAPAHLRARIKSAHNVDVPELLAPDLRDDCDPETLVAGAGQVFLSGLRRLGLDPGLSESLVRRVEEHAAATLFEPVGDLPDEVIAICALTSLRI